MQPINIEAPSNTPNWYAARRGCLTGSRMEDAMAYLKTGKPSQARLDYIADVVNERLTGEAVTHYVTPAMQWGIDQEDAAKAAYEVATGRLIEACGFVRHDSIEWFGATPDGLVGDGLIEIKCPTSRKYQAWILAGVVPEEHKPQMIAECVCAGREWVDFVAYDPRMPERQRLFVRRYTPTKEEREAVEAEAIRFLAEVDEMFDRILSTECVQNGL